MGARPAGTGTHRCRAVPGDALSRGVARRGHRVQRPLRPVPRFTVDLQHLAPPSAGAFALSSWTPSCPTCAPAATSAPVYGSRGCAAPRMSTNSPGPWAPAPQDAPRSSKEPRSAPVHRTSSGAASAPTRSSPAHDQLGLWEATCAIASVRTECTRFAARDLTSIPPDGLAGRGGPVPRRKGRTGPEASLAQPVPARASILALRGSLPIWIERTPPRLITVGAAVVAFVQ